MTTQTLEEKLIEALAIINTLNDKIKTLNHEYTNRGYKIDALVNMLGPNGKKVWELWKKKNVTRMHYDWGPEAHKLSGEERAAFILDLEDHVKYPRTPLTFKKKRNVREFIESLEDNPPVTGKEPSELE